MELFSKRSKKVARKDKPPALVYNKLPEAFRNQVVMILLATLGEYDPPAHYSMVPASVGTQMWHTIFRTYAEAVGKFVLWPVTNLENVCDQCTNFTRWADATDVLDFLEIAFSLIYQRLSSLDEFDRSRLQIRNMLPADEAIRKLNARFQEHNLGYEFVDGRLIKRDNEFIHAEVVAPAIQLLHDSGFRGASDEFLKAHEHYRHGNYKEAMNEALKAVESTIKSICSQRHWAYLPTANAKALMTLILDKGLIPKSLDSSSGSLLSFMEGVATMRNKNSGHGQGDAPSAVPEHLAAYTLHLAAANIVLLVKAHKESK